MQSLEKAYRNADGSASIQWWGPEGVYRPASFRALNVIHPRFGLVDIQKFGVVDTRTGSLKLTTHCDLEGAEAILAAAASILNTNQPLMNHCEDRRSGCDRFQAEDMSDADGGPHICIVDRRQISGEIPYVLYGRVGVNRDEIVELMTRVVEGLNRMGMETIAT